MKELNQAFRVSDEQLPLSKAGRLARLLALKDSEPDSWSAGDVASMVQHQLSAPVRLDIPHAFKAEARSSSEAPEVTLSHVDITFRELFFGPSPSLVLLRLTKDLAKRQLRDDARGLPPEVAYALYYTSILVALWRLNTRISSLSPQALMRGLRGLMRAVELPMELRNLYEQGLASLDAN